MPTPSRCSSGRWRSARSRFHRGHPDVAQSLNNLATLYEKQDRHADSEPLFKRALVIYEKAAGPEHPAVATLLNNLGQVDKVQGRYAEAEPEIKRSLSIREKVLGRDHPDVARSLNNLADLYERQGRYADAEPLYQRAAAIREARTRARSSRPRDIAEQSCRALSGGGTHRRCLADRGTDDRKWTRAAAGCASGAVVGAAAAIDAGREGTGRCAQRGSARRPVVGRVRGEQARGSAGRRKRSAGASWCAGIRTSPPRRRRWTSPIIAAVSKAKSKRDPAAEQRARARLARHFRRARDVAENPCGRIPGLRRVVEPAADDGQGDSGAVVRRRGDGAVRGGRQSELRLRADARQLRLEAAAIGRGSVVAKGCRVPPRSRCRQGERCIRPSPGCSILRGPRSSMRRCWGRSRRL